MVRDGDDVVRNVGDVVRGVDDIGRNGDEAVSYTHLTLPTSVAV